MKKYPLPILTLIIATVIFSCTKGGDSSVSYPNSISGKWKVNTDSLDYGIGPVQKTKIYIGVAGDYFDFRNDGKLYIKEGAELDTFVYKVISQNKLQITTSNPNSIPQSLFIDNLNTTSAQINIFPTLLNPGGNDDRRVNLVR
jgi:hypothetical protein